MRLATGFVLACGLALPAVAYADIVRPQPPVCTLDHPDARGRSCRVCRSMPDIPGWCRDAGQAAGWASICTEAADGGTREVWCLTAEGSQAPIESPPIERVPEPGESDASGERAAQATAEASGQTVAAADEGSAATPDVAAPTSGGVALAEDRGCASAPIRSIAPLFAAVAALVVRRRRTR